MTELVRKGIFVIEIPEGVPLPDGLVLLHEHSDHYSLQPSRPMKPDDFIALVKTFVKPFRVLTANDYADEFPYMEA